MDELKNTASELSKIKKETPFQVPENYFDDFSARLQVKLEAEKTGIPKQQNRIVQFLKPALGLAASFFLIFMLVYYPLKNYMSSQDFEQAELIDNTETEFLNIIEGIDENSFFALLEGSNNDDNFSDDDLVAYVSANFTDYEIFEYTEN